MHQIDQVLISDEVWDLRFDCDLSQCRGNCCRMGNLGAPVDEEEVENIQKVLPQVYPLLPSRNRPFLEAGITELYQGKLHLREIAPDHPCPLGFIDAQGVLLCSLHSLSLEENMRVEAVKPLWCRLFPLMITKTLVGWQVNVRLTESCRSRKPAPPILLAFSNWLTPVFGQEWMDKVLALLPK